MADWKKIIVSGSDVSQLNNDAGYLTAATGIQKAFVSASFNGTILIADSISGSLNFASSSGQGLAMSANATTDTLTFGLSSVPNSSLANSTISGVALGGTLAALTAGAGLTSPGTYTGASTRILSVDSASMAPFFATASYAGVTGDVSISSAGVATIQPNSVALGTDTTGNYIATLIAGTGITSTGATTGENIAHSLSINYGSTAGTAVQGNTTLTVNGTANEIEITGATTQTLGNTSTYTIGLPNSVTIATGSILNDLTVNGNLYVQGTATYVNTADLYVTDKFILLASGSATAGDGGIVIDRGSDLGGNVAYGYDSTTSRWGYQNGLTDTSNAITIGTNGNSAFAGYVFTQASHITAPTTGEFVAAGAIYTSTSGDIFIYS
tara:strand:+ start:2394 stop:3542 length:1149 start_codon:yes stop_codon:yes gene_type:complete